MPGSNDPNFYRTIIDSLRVAVYVVDREGRIVLWNDGAERVTGYLRQDVIGRVCLDNFLGQTDRENNDLSGPQAPLQQALHEGKRSEMAASLRHKMGHHVPVQLRTFPVKDEQGAISGAVESFEENISVAEWDQRQSKSYGYGGMDRAAGVLSQAVMRLHLEEVMENYVQHPVPFSVLAGKIDHMDKVKSRDGPAAVAMVSRVVEKTLENSLRPADFIGQWNENGFLMILMECTQTEIERVAERLRRMVSFCKVEWWGDPVPVTMSLGGTEIWRGDNADSLAGRAEEALREAIAQGGNRAVVRVEQEKP